MSRQQWEIKTLKQNMEGNVGGEDAELAAHLNDGWEIMPELSGLSMMSSTYGDHDQFVSSYPCRMITLRRKLPSAFDRLFDASMALVRVIESKHPFLPGQSEHDDDLATIAKHWRRFGKHRSLLVALKPYRERGELTPEMDAAFHNAAEALAAWEASGGEGVES